MKSGNYLRGLFQDMTSSRNGWKALIILAIGLILTAITAVYDISEDSIKQKNENLMVCNEIRTKISFRVQAHALLLRTGSAFFAASDTITRKEWKAFNENAKIEKNLPGIQGLGFAMIIPGNKLKQHIQQIRLEGFPDYTIRPTGDREVYTSIIFLEPFSGRNLRAFGYDMFTEPVRRKAMEMSRDSNLAILSGRVILVQETNRDVQTGTLMYVPVYKNGMPVNTVEQRRLAIKGWVYSPYRMYDLMNGILGRWDLNLQDRIHLQIYDDSISTNSLLYDSQRKDTLNHNDLPVFTISLPVEFNGVKWILNFTKSREQSAANPKVIIIVIGGIAISLLLFALLLSLFNTRYRAHRIAEKLTADLKESEERFKILLNSTSEGIYGLDLNGNCTFSNHACHQLLGYENSEQLIGKNMHHLIHYARADGSVVNETDSRIYKSFSLSEQVHADDEVFWRADGNYFPVEYWSNPIAINGKTEGSVVTFFDITERKLSENNLREAKHEAERANLAKSHLLSRISHELCTPMNSILGFAQLMELGELNPAHRKAVNYILKSGKQLLTLINEVLDISSIETGKLLLIPEPMQLSEPILEMIEEVRPFASKRDIKIEMEPSPAASLVVMIDGKRIRQVLFNLISNAVQYNREGGSVKIRTEFHPMEVREFSLVRISVCDTGVGIKPEYIGQLFLPFERIETEENEFDGTGLGLTVVKKLIVAMGGDVGVESVYGKGSTFWIELPLTSEKEMKQGARINTHTP